MAIVNKFNVNNRQVTLDADIIENMSANDVSYNVSTQYNKNTVGNKLSKLESEIDVFKEDVTDEVTVFKETVTEQVNNYKPIVINGNVTNAQDEEDLTSVDGLLKFKNRSALNGMGYVILRKNKSFAEQVTKENTIYEIRYDFTLNENVTIPANCVLKFNGGSIKGAYTLVGNNTYIDSNSLCIKKDVIISGTWSNETIYTRWFEFVSTDDGTTDNLIVFRQLRNIINGTKSCKVEFEQGYYQYGCDIKPDGIIDGIPKYLTNEWNNDEFYALPIINISYVDINLNGSTIKALTTNAPRFCFIAFVNIPNAYIHDGSIIGFANTFNYPVYIRYDNTQVRSYEWSNAIAQMGGFLTVRNINVSNFHGDGIMVGTDAYFFKGDTTGKYFPSKGYLIENCEVSYCARNGITLHSSNAGTLKNVYIHNIGSDAESGTIGTDGIRGTSPQAGIDIEFEDGQGLTPIMNWENLYIHDCRQKSFSFASSNISKMKEFYCKNSIFLGFGLPNNLNSETGNNVFSNCYFRQTLSSIDGTLLSSYTTYNDCSFVLDKGEVLIGSRNVFNNCSFIDERTDTLNTHLYYQTEQIETKFNHCHFDIKGSIGYLGPKSKFYTCTFNIQCIKQWFIANASFYDCIFNNDIQDTQYCFNFNEGNIEIEQGKTLSFERCIFDKSYGIADDMSSKFFNISKLKLKDCEFKDTINLIMTDGYNFIIKNTTAPKIFSRPYSPNGSTAEPYKLYIDNCKLDKFFLFVNDDDRYDNSITIKDSEITTDTAFGNINMEGGKLNARIASEIHKIRVKNSIIKLPESTGANTLTFNLENCYINNGNEVDFQGTAINCTFKVPFPKSGTFASRPVTSPIGFKYFCTDKQTTEGTTDGIEIIHKGNDVWVDALGRVIS